MLSTFNHEEEGICLREGFFRLLFGLFFLCLSHDHLIFASLPFLRIHLSWLLGRAEKGVGESDRQGVALPLGKDAGVQDLLSEKEEEEKGR